jgi:hypothetical protein
VAFNEYGQYVKTDPYISNEELRFQIVDQAIERVKSYKDKVSR